MMKCPSDERLERFLGERLSTAECAALEEHLARCARCQQRLHELTSDPTLERWRNLLAQRHENEGTPGWASLDGLAPMPPARAAGQKDPVRDTEPAAARGADAPPGAPFTHLGGDGGTVGRAAEPAPWPAVPGYEVLGELGRGGMGVVYRARQAGLNRFVALKMIRAGDRAGADALARFSREAEAAGRLRHPNLVQVYEVGWHEGLPFFCLEYVDGGSLAERLDGVPHLARPAAALVEVLARAMHYVHECGIVHRDLKPSNILLQIADCSLPIDQPQTAICDLRSARPKITDFGLAKLLDEDARLTRSGVIVGTPGYMAPEQVIAGPQPVGPAADVYALGAILYELLSGRPPFVGPTALDTVEQVVHAEPVPPRRLQPRVPSNLETVCLKCLHKEPQKRYASALDLAEDLHRFLAGIPIQARPSGTWERGFKWAKRRPAVAALVTVSFLAVLSFAVGGWWHNVQLRRANQIAEDRRQAAQDQESEARSNLYRSLVGEARALRQAGRDGYRVKAWGLLQQALHLETPQRNLLELRQEAVASLGDFVGLEPRTWSDLPADIRTIDLHPDSLHLAVGLEDGTVLVRNIRTGKQTPLPREHRAPVVSLAIGADGKRMASADLGGIIKVWQSDPVTLWACTKTIEIAPPKSLSTPGQSRFETVSVALGPGSKTLAFCSSDQSEVSVQNLADGIRAVPFSGREGDHLHGLAFSPDGSLFAAGYERKGAHSTMVWASSTPHTPIAELPIGDIVGRIAFSPDGRFLAVAGGQPGLTVYRTSDFTSYRFVGGDFPKGLAFSPDSQTVALTATDRGLIRLWKFSSNRFEAVLEAPGPGYANSVLFSGDGKSLVAASRKAVRIWDCGGCSEKLNLSGQEGGVPGVAFSPDGTLLVSAGKDNTFKIWNPATGQPIRPPLTGFDDPESVAFSPDGKWLATGDGGVGLRMWAVESWQELPAPEHQLDLISSSAFSPDGRYFAACGKGVTLWRMEYRPANEGKKARLSLESPARLSTSPVAYLCFDSASSLLAWADHAGARLHVWDLVHSRPHPFPPDARPVIAYRSLAFHPRSKHLGFIGPRLVPEFWDVAAGQRALSFDGEELGNGTTFPAGVVGRSEIGDTGIIALSADGAWLAQQGSAVKIWDVDKKDLLLVLPEERSTPWCFAWSPDKRRLAVGSCDGSLVIWNIPKIRSQLAEIGLDW
jgi:eukaryotic-like serine/threonine-protein kinase